MGAPSDDAHVAKRSACVCKRCRVRCQSVKGTLRTHSTRSGPDGTGHTQRGEPWSRDERLMRLVGCYGCAARDDGDPYGCKKGPGVGDGVMPANGP